MQTFLFSSGENILYIAIIRHWLLTFLLMVSRVKPQSRMFGGPNKRVDILQRAEALGIPAEKHSC